MLRMTWALLAGVTLLASCGDPSGMFEGDTVRETTVRLDYNETARSHEEAQAEVRKLCGTAEVLSVSEPTVAESGLNRVTAQCLSTFDKHGNQIENDRS